MGRARSRGFTLIEVVVAFAILALSAGAIYESLGMALRRTQRSVDEGSAVLVAQSLLDRAGVEWALRDADRRDGVDGAFHWTIDAALLRPPPNEPAYTVAAYEVTAKVTWNRAGVARDLSLRKILLQGPS